MIHCCKKKYKYKIPRPCKKLMSDINFYKDLSFIQFVLHSLSLFVSLFHLPFFHNSLSLSLSPSLCLKTTLPTISPSFPMQVHSICQRANKKLICLDHTWTANPKKEFDDDQALPGVLAGAETLPSMSDRAMILYARNGNERG